MTFEETKDLIENRFGAETVLGIDDNATPKALLINAEQIAEVCEFLKDDENAFFDLLSCITGLDNGVEANTMEVIYNLYSIPLEQVLMIKCKISREHPKIDSVAHIWRTADWHERESYDLLGIQFKNHPDLRRILMPADWEGYPLRKDYEEPAEYRGMKTMRDEGDPI